MEFDADILDVIVVGGGPAGLTAGIYLGRFRRRCLVLEDGNSRARWIPTSHNIPGFTAGIGGGALLAALGTQARKYGAVIRTAHVTGLTVDRGIFSIATGGGTLHSRYVILATGVRDHLPAIEGASEAVMRSLLRVCPICDAFEAIDMRIAVIGDGELGEREARFLKNYSSRVTLLHIGPQRSDPDAAVTGADGIERLSVKLSDLSIQADRVTLAAGSDQRRFDVAYLALGCSAQHHLARSLHATCDEHGALRVNTH